MFCEQAGELPWIDWSAADHCVQYCNTFCEQAGELRWIEWSAADEMRLLNTKVTFEALRSFVVP